MVQHSDDPVENRIASIAERFATHWNANCLTDLANYLAEIDDSHRRQLLCRLLDLDLDRRRQAGLELDPEVYRTLGAEAVSHVQMRLSVTPPTHGDTVDQDARDQATIPPKPRSDRSNSPSTGSAETILPTSPKPSAGDAKTQRGTAQDAPTIRPRTQKQTDTQLETMASAADPSVISNFGEYEILAEIARGGMGVVYRARQRKLNRDCALKMILSGQLAGEDEVARFYSEAESAANLSHNGIVPIFEVGEVDGQHFFSMGFIDGESLQDRVRDRPLSSTESADLMIQIGHAIAHAHQQGVVHRDLKPANILIDSNGDPKVTDFGLAKRTAGDSNLTATGQILGTPGYMPPEQAKGEVDNVDELSDLYSLGGILYCLLTARPPFQAATPMDTLMQVLEQEPIAPRQLNPQVPRDLETICLKSLAKEKSRRYASVEEFVAELERFQRGEPILARPVGHLEKGIRWCRRKPYVAGLVASLAVVLLALAIGGPLVAFNQAYLKGIAQTKETEAREAQDQAERAAAAEKVAKGEAVAALQESDRLRRKAESDLYATKIALAFQEWLANHMSQARQLLNECPEEFRNWEWRYLQRLCSQEVLSLRGNSGDVIVRYDDEKKQLVTAGNDLSVRLFDQEDGSQVYRRYFQTSSLRLGDQGKKLLTVTDDSVSAWNIQSEQPLQTIKLVDRQLVGTAIGRTLFAVASLPRDLEALDKDETRGRVDVHDLKSGKIRWSFDVPKRPVLYLQFSPTEKQFAVGEFSTIRVFDLDDSKSSLEPTQRFGGHYRSIQLIKFNPAGTRLASCSADGRVRVWDTDQNRLHLDFHAHDEGVTEVEFSRDGSLIATGSINNSVKLWDAETGAPRLTLRGMANQVKNVAFIKGDSQLAIASAGPVKVFDISGARNFPSVIESIAGRNQEKPSSDASSAIDSNPKEGAQTEKSGTTSDSESRGEIESLGEIESPGEIESRGEIESTEQIADGGNKDKSKEQMVADYFARHLDQRYTTLFPRTGAVQKAVFSPNGTLLANIGFNGSVDLWKVADVEAGQVAEPFHRFPEPGGCGLDLAFNFDQTLLACSAGNEISPKQPALNGDVRIWDLESKEIKFTLVGHQNLVTGIDFARESNLLISCDGITPQLQRGLNFISKLIKDANTARPASIRLWDVDAGKLIREFGKGPNGYADVHLMRNDKRAVSCTLNGLIQVWDTQTATEISNIRTSLSSSPNSIAVFEPRTTESATKGSPNQRRAGDVGKELVAVACLDSTVQVFDLTTGELMWMFDEHTKAAKDVVFSPDGKRLFSCSDDGTIKVWNITSGQQLLNFFGHNAPVMTLAFDPMTESLVSCSLDNTAKIWHAGESNNGPSNSGDMKLTVFEDDFEREEIGPDWSPVNGEWSIREGKLVGKLNAANLPSTNFDGVGSGSIRLLPVEVPPDSRLEFEFRSSVPNGIQAYFLNDQANGEVIEMLGVPNPYNSLKGTTIYEQNGSLQFRPQPANRDFPIEANKTYAVEVLRTENRVAVRINDRLISEGEFRTAKFPYLMLNPMYGPVGSELVIDNVRITTNRSSRDRVTARKLVRELFSEVLLPSEVRRRLEKDESIAPGIRQHFDAELRELKPDPRSLSSASREASQQSDGTNEEYQLAYQQAKTAYQSRPGFVPFLASLAMASYRVGDYEESIEFAELTNVQHRKRLGVDMPKLVGFAAMARWKLGDKDSAVEQFARFRDMVKCTLRLRNNPVLVDLLDEAQELMADSLNLPEIEKLDEVKEAILIPLQQGLQNHDINSFLTPWLPQARDFYQRSETEDAFTFALPFEEMKRLRELRFQGPPEEANSLYIDHVQVDVDGSQGTLVADVAYLFHLSRMKFSLKKVADQWKIDQRRSWVLRRPDGPVTGDKLAALDEQIDKLGTLDTVSGKEAEMAIELLVKARRLREWLKLLIKQAEDSNPKVDDWFRICTAAYLAGEPATLQMAMDKILEMNPIATGPGYFEVYAEKKNGGPRLKEYAHGVSLASPASWEIGRKNQFGVPGELLAGWWIDKPNNLVVYRAATAGPTDLNLWTSQQSWALANQGFRISEQGVITIGDRKFGVVKGSAMGSGAGFQTSGTNVKTSGAVRTLQRYVAYPREKDLITFLVTGPESDFEKAVEKQEQLIKSLVDHESQ